MSKRAKKISPVTDVAVDTPLTGANEVQSHEANIADSAVLGPSAGNPPSKALIEPVIAESPFVNPMLEKKLTPEQQEIVDNYDRINDENAKLVAENSELKEKIAEYISELDTLRSKSMPDDKLKDAEKKLAEAEKKISELEREVKSLQDANDKYLMKISDLTFENARLASEVQSKEPVDLTPSISKGDAVKVEPTSKQSKHTNTYMNVYRTAMNGYSDWN